MKSKTLYFLLLSLASSIFAQTPGPELIWETFVFPNSHWKFLPANSELPTNWHESNFNDSSWETTNRNVGFGDNDDSLQIEQVKALALRHKFNSVNINSIKQIVLHADYDDAFVAFLNGVEIARANIEEPNSPVFFNSEPDYKREAHLYRGGQAEYFLVDTSKLENLLQEENCLSILVLNEFDSNDLTGFFWLSSARNLEDSPLSQNQTSSWFIPPVFLNESQIPIVSIETDANIILDDPRIRANLKVYWNEDGSPNKLLNSNVHISCPISIEKRGSSSQTRFPKKSYAFETQDSLGENFNTSLVGLPSENDWILYGPYSDKALLRNDLTFYLANQMGLNSPKTKFCELLINNQYQGLYVLMESVKRDKNRVDISKLKEIDIEGDELTGGYIIKLDKKTGEGGEGWNSTFPAPTDSSKPVFFQYHYPEEGDIVPQQMDYISSYVDSFETALHSSTNLGVDTNNDYQNYIDIQSFIHFFLINELAYNVDAYRLSTFIYKDKNSKANHKLIMGPVWDFNLAFGNGFDCNGQNQEGWMIDFNKSCGERTYHVPFWWDKFLEDVRFRDELACTWENLRQTTLSWESIESYIDSKLDLILPAAQRNFVRWPILKIKVWPNLFDPGSYEQEISLLKNWIQNRLIWMDQNMPGTCFRIKPENEQELNTFIYPNPSSSHLYIELFLPSASKINVYLHNSIGQELKQPIKNGVLNSGLQQLRINTDHLSSGLYFVTIKALNEYHKWPLYIK